MTVLAIRRGSSPECHKQLVDQHVAEAGDRVLVEQNRLQRRSTSPEHGRQLGACHVEQVRPQRSHVGVEREPGPAPRIVDSQHPAVGELDAETIPTRLVAPAGIVQLLDRRRAVEHEPPGHPEVQPDRGTVGAEQQELADAVGRGELAPANGIGEVRRREPVVDEHVRHPPTDRADRGAAVQLDLQAFGHVASVVDGHRCGTLATS